LKIDILTLFPEMFAPVLSAGVIGRAAERGLLEFRVTDIRDHTEDKHRKADDYPFGGGAGQLMTAQPIFSALRSLGVEPDMTFGTSPSPSISNPTITNAFEKPSSSSVSEPCENADPSSLQRENAAPSSLQRENADPASLLMQNKTSAPRMLYLSPRGRLLDKDYAEELSREPGLVLLCGHYEGVDQRVLDAFAFEEASIGDYILTGGELPAMVLVDIVCRLIPGILGSEASHAEESLYSGLLEYPQYTRPASFEGMGVPDTLISGDHAKIALWNFEQSLKLTAERRPDLLRAWLAANYDGLDKKRKAIVEPYLY